MQKWPSDSLWWDDIDDCCDTRKNLKRWPPQPTVLGSFAIVLLKSGYIRKMKEKNGQKRIEGEVSAIEKTERTAERLRSDGRRGWKRAPMR
jgi:hypothetical protein